MIVVVEPHSAEKHGHLLEQMFRMRARIFHDHLGWDVVVKDGMERDKYDEQSGKHGCSPRKKKKGLAPATFRILANPGVRRAPVLHSRSTLRVHWIMKHPSVGKPNSPPVPFDQCFSRGRSSQRHSAGRNTIAASMLTTNMKVSMTPMSAWNLRSENIHIATPAASVSAV